MIDEFIKITNKLFKLAIFLSHIIAGYALYNNANSILATTGVVLIMLVIIQVLNISFNETNNLNNRK